MACFHCTVAASAITMTFACHCLHPGPCVCHRYEWDVFKLGDQCLTHYIHDVGPVRVTLEDCQDENDNDKQRFKWECSGCGPHDDPSSWEYAIRVGAYSNGETMSDSCIAGNVVDADTSFLSILKCGDTHQLWFKNGQHGALVIAANEGHDRCLDGGSAVLSGKTPKVSPCNGDPQQNWTISNYLCDDDCDAFGWPTTTAAPAAGTPIQSLLTLLCVDLPGGNTFNGALLWMWDCSGGESQQWSLQDNQLVYLPDSTKCVDLLGGDNTNGNQLGLWDCHGGDSQQWGFDSDMGTIYLASSARDATKCIQTYGENVGAPILIWDCIGAESETWKLVSDLDYPLPLLV